MGHETYLESADAYFARWVCTPVSQESARAHSVLIDPSRDEPVAGYPSVENAVVLVKNHTVFIALGPSVAKCFPQAVPTLEARLQAFSPAAIDADSVNSLMADIGIAPFRFSQKFYFDGLPGDIDTSTARELNRCGSRSELAADHHRS